MATVQHSSPPQSNGISNADQQNSLSTELTLASTTSSNSITSGPLGLQLGDDWESGALVVSASEMESLTLRREEAADRERALARKTMERRDHFDKVAIRAVDNARSLVTLLEDELKQSTSPDTIQSGDELTPALETLHLLSEQVDTLFHLALEVQVIESTLLQDHKEVAQLHHNAIHDEDIARFRMSAMALHKRFVMYHQKTLENTTRTFAEATAAKDELIGTLKQKASQFALKHGLFKSQIEELSKEKKSLEIQLREQVTTVKNCHAALAYASERERALREELTEAHENAVTSQETSDTRRKEPGWKIEDLEATLAVSVNDLMKVREEFTDAREAHESETAKLKDVIDRLSETLFARQSDLESAQEEVATGCQQEQALATVERENKALHSEKAELSTALIEVQTQLSKAQEGEAKASEALERRIGEVEVAAQSSIATLENKLSACETARCAAEANLDMAYQQARETHQQVELWRSKHAENEKSTRQRVDNETSQRQAAEALAMQLKMENKKLRAELDQSVSENKMDRRKSIDHMHELEAQLAVCPPTPRSPSWERALTQLAVVVNRTGQTTATV